MGETPTGKLRSTHFWLPIILSIVIILGFGGVGLYSWYQSSLNPVSSSSMNVYFSVEKGNGVSQIAHKLKDAGLIRSTSAFEYYVWSKRQNNGLQAGTYILSPSMSTDEIVNKMIKGDVAKNLLTILPGKRLDQIKKAFLAAKYSPAEVEAAFTPANYRGHPALASLPEGASLEGYLYPDSFQKQSDTPAQVIIRESLDEMQKYLTDSILKGFTAHGLTTRQAIILASIVGQESGDPKYQSTVAQVLLLRLKQDRPLQADVTADYAAAIAGQPRNLNIDSPYNTYLNKGLPPGPISNVTASALKTVAHPADTDYLFFVAGDDGKVYFSHTQEEHQQLVNQYCKKKCAQ